MRTVQLLSNEEAAHYAQLLAASYDNSWEWLDEGGRYKRYLTETTAPTWVAELRKKVIAVFGFKNLYREPSTYQSLMRFDPGIKFSEHTDTVYKGFKHRRYNVFFTCPDTPCYLTQGVEAVQISLGVAYEIFADEPHGLTRVEGVTPLCGVLFSFLHPIDEASNNPRTA